MNERRSRFWLQVHPNTTVVHTFSKALGRQRYHRWIDWAEAWCIFTYQHRLGCIHKDFWIYIMTPLKAFLSLSSTLLASSILLSALTRSDRARAPFSTILILPSWLHRIPRSAIVLCVLPLLPFFFSMPTKPLYPAGGGPWGASCDDYRNRRGQSYSQTCWFHIFHHRSLFFGYRLWFGHQYL